MWVDMEAMGVDVLVTAPQKGWSGSPCCAMVMLCERATEAIEGTTSTSFACDLKKWLQIMDAYEGRPRLPRHHAHRRPGPDLRDVMQEARDYGFEKVRGRAGGTGRRGARPAGEPRPAQRRRRGFKAPGVVVSYTDDPEVHYRQEVPRRSACRRPPACRCSATSPRTS